MLTSPYTMGMSIHLFGNTFCLNKESKKDSGHRQNEVDRLVLHCWFFFFFFQPNLIFLKGITTNKFGIFALFDKAPAIMAALDDVTGPAFFERLCGDKFIGVFEQQNGARNVTIRQYICTDDVEKRPIKVSPDKCGIELDGNQFNTLVQRKAVIIEAINNAEMAAKAECIGKESEAFLEIWSKSKIYIIFFTSVIQKK